MVLAISESSFPRILFCSSAGFCSFCYRSSVGGEFLSKVKYSPLTMWVTKLHGYEYLPINSILNGNSRLDNHERTLLPKKYGLMRSPNWNRTHLYWPSNLSSVLIWNALELGRYVEQWGLILRLNSLLYSCHGETLPVVERDKTGSSTYLVQF